MEYKQLSGHHMSGFGLPTYKPQERRSGKSQQVWIARHRRWLGS